MSHNTPRTEVYALVDSGESLCLPVYDTREEAERAQKSWPSCRVVHLVEPPAGEGKEGSGSAKASPEPSALEALERCSVLFFLQVQKLARIRQVLEDDDYVDGPGTILSLLSHMKKEIQEQSAEIRRVQQEAKRAAGISPSSSHPQALDLRAALSDALEGLEDMIGYVDEYFRKKWDHQGYIDRAKAALAASPSPESLGGGL